MCVIRYILNFLSSLLKKQSLSYQKACVISARQEEENYHTARKDWLEKTLLIIIKN